MDKLLIVLLGPTGVGKSDLAVRIATHFSCEIVSADSRQFYREMEKGTAVPPDHLLNSVRHHFIQFMSVKEYYSASLYERDVTDLLSTLFNSNSIVLLTGGSGMYINAVCEGIDDIPDINPAVREKYLNKYREEGVESLRMELRVIDPDYYARVDLKNPKRIIRALEIYGTTGRTYSSFLKGRKRKREFRIIKIGLRRERADLYNRINLRVDDMIRAGLEEEARRLYIYKDLNALNCVGYKELFDCFEGRVSREKAIDLIKRNSRRYAKRQMTWWNRDTAIRWFHPDQLAEITDYISLSLKEYN